MDGKQQMTYEEAISIIIRDNKELLDRLGSDYDEDGTPYWEKKDA